MSSNASIWSTDAMQKLHEAQAIGSKANNILLQTRSCVKANYELYSKGNFLLDAIDQQLQTLETLVKCISFTVKKRETAVSDLSDYLASSIDALEVEYQYLKDIRIEKSLGCKSKTLYDLVTTDILKQLISKDQDLSEIFTNCIPELKEKERIINTKIKTFTGGFNKLESKSTHLGDNSWIDLVMQELRGFEEEIADLIESVTSHYDQCMRGVQVENADITISEKDKRELFAVLEKDFNELPDVVNDIEETFHDINMKCQKVLDFAKYQSWFDEISELLRDLTKFGEIELCHTLNSLTVQSTAFKKIENDIADKCEESKEIIAHYHSFTKAYYFLILEIQRRNQTKAQIHQIIKETQYKLSKLQEEDYKQRQQFLSRHGAFLPSDLYLGINDIDEPLFKLQYELTDVPVFDKELISLAERFIKSSSRESSV